MQIIQSITIQVIRIQEAFLIPITKGYMCIPVQRIQSLFFSYGKYERSLKYLKGFKGLNYLHYSDSTILKLCNYYEMESYEEAISEIDKLRQY